MKKFFIIAYFVSILLPSNEEHISYLVKYNGITAGEATLLKKIIKDNINITFNLQSRKFIDLIYKLRESVSITVDKTNYSILNIDKYTQQGKYKKTYKAFFDYNNSIGMINNNPVSLTNNIYDPISIIYSLRNKTLKKDQVYKYNIISKNSIKEIEMRVIGNETVKIKNIEYECSILEAINSADKEKIKRTDALKLWISSDQLAIPVIIEKEAKNGTITMEIQNYK